MHLIKRELHKRRFGWANRFFTFPVIKCVNLKYTYGDAVPNPWHSLGYGPDGPVDYKDPQHFTTDPSNFKNSWEYLKIEGLEDQFDPDGILPKFSEASTPDSIKDFVHSTPEDAETNPGRRKPPTNDVIPPNPPPRLKDLIKPVSPQSEIDDDDDAEEDASAGSAADDPDYSLFSSPIADSGTSKSDIFNGAANGASHLTATLDTSIFDNSGSNNNLFNDANQADLTAFDSTSPTIISNIASLDGSSSSSSSNNNDWTSSLLPGGSSDLFTADSGGKTPSTSSNDDDLFAAGNSGTAIDDLFAAENGKTITTGGGDLAVGSTGDHDNNLFAKRSRKTSPRDFRF